MNRIASAILAAGFAVAAPGLSVAQTAQDLVGTWAHIENVNLSKDGARTDTFGPNPKGSAIFTSNGRFSFYFHRADLPKFAGNNRAQGTAEENRAIVAGGIALYGTYTVAEKVLLLKVEGSTFPNWIDTDQKRPIAAFSGSEFTILNAGGSAGGQNTVRFKRID
jgi:hypothetical protein